MERKKFKIIIFLTLAFNSVFAQNYLDSLLIVAAKNNPGLKAKYYKYMADLQKVPQVGALPDPDVSFGFFIQPMELMSGNQIGQIQLMQMFPWIGTLKAAKDEASAMALSSLELFRAEKDELFFNIRKNYYRLSLVNKQIQTYDSTLILLKSLEQLLLSKNKTSNTGIPEPVNSGTQLSLFNSSKQNNSMGMNQNNLQSGQQKMSNLSMSESNSAFSDLLKLQIEIKEVTDNISTLKTSYQQLTIQINILLNCKPGTVIVVSDSLNTPLIDFNNPTIFDSIKANNPMIRMNKTDIQVFQLRQVMNKKMGYPMFGVGLNYMLINKIDMNASSMNGKDMIMPMFTVKVPVYRKKYNASVKEAELMEKSANEQLNNTENMLFMEYSDYRFALNDAERKQNLYKELISLTQRDFDLLLTQYATAGIDMESLIRIHRQLLDYKLNISQAQVDELTAIAGIRKLLSNN